MAVTDSRAISKRFSEADPVDNMVIPSPANSSFIYDVGIITPESKKNWSKDNVRLTAPLPTTTS
jgi:hypothetical protein